MALKTGQILQNRYRIVALLGQGGMGAVYRAWDLRLKKPVALKEMIPQPDLDPKTLEDLREQFEQEAVILARMDHPSLVDVNDFFEEDGNAYLTMDYVEGRSLADIIAQEGVQPEEQVVTWAEQILDALAYCHAQGILHRDIKPQNVIIRSDGRAVLVDFGLVKLWDPNAPKTRTVMRGMGTPQYAPPEQYDTHIGHTDPRTDLYSLGATLYHAMTGQVPPTATQRIANHVSFRAPRQLNQQISPRLDRVILTAMELPLEFRYRSAEAMAKALTGEESPGPTPYAGPYPAEQPSDSAWPSMTAALPPQAASQPQYWSGAQPKTTPPEEKRRRGRGWLWGIMGIFFLLLLAGGGLAFAGSRGYGPLMAVFDPTPTPSPIMEVTDTPVPTSTSTPEPSAMPTETPTATPTPRPTSTASAADDEATSTATATATNTPSPTPTTSAPTATATVTVVPTTPAPTATPGATATKAPTSPPPTSPPPSGSPSVVFNFEQNRGWQRGNEPYGTFTRSGEQIHGGSSSGKLEYDFPAEQVNYVVFRSTDQPGLSGQPSGLTAWVYGDGSGHFLNAWIQDNAGEVRQYTFGRISHTGWQRMSALFDEGRGWPNVHISGPDNGGLDYPVSFFGILLDGVPDGAASTGTIYIDDILTSFEAAPAPTATSAPGTGSAYRPPTSPPLRAGGTGGIVVLALLAGFILPAALTWRTEDL